MADDWLLKYMVEDIYSRRYKEGRKTAEEMESCSERID